MLTIYSTPLSANGRKVLAVSRQLEREAVAGFPFDPHPGFTDWYHRIEATDGWRVTQDPIWAG